MSRVHSGFKVAMRSLGTCGYGLALWLSTPKGEKGKKELYWEKFKVVKKNYQWQSILEWMRGLDG